jgi:glutamyl-tRNA reductase
MPIKLIGVDFKTADVEIRERVAMDSACALQLLHTIAAERILPEAMVLSTCNRTEFYFTTDGKVRDPLGHLLGHVALIKGAPPLEDISMFYRREGLDAVRHLMCVASSLKSQVVGEHEIMGQVKEAYRLACEAQTARFLFHKLAHWTFRTGKRVFSETQLGQGTASVSQAAVDLARHVFKDLAGKKVMLVGAGQTAELAAQALVRSGVRSIVIANRTLSRAEQLAGSFRQWRLQDTAAEAQAGPVRCPALVTLLADCPAEEQANLPRPPHPELHVSAIELPAIASTMAGVDLVISSTGSSEPVLTQEGLAAALHHRQRPLLLIDIAVPRDIDVRLADVPNVFLYNIDDLQGIVEHNLQRRRQEVPRALAIVEDEVSAFGQWMSSLDAVPTIKQLEQRFAMLQQEQMLKYHRKMTDAQREQLQEFARGLCNKILHGPRSFLRKIGGGSSNGSDLAAVGLLRQMFGLDSMDDAPAAPKEAET